MWSDRLALKPYWGKPAVRNFRGGDGNAGIIEARTAPSPYPASGHEVIVGPVGPVAAAKDVGPAGRCRRGLRHGKGDMTDRGGAGEQEAHERAGGTSQHWMTS